MFDKFFDDQMTDEFDDDTVVAVTNRLNMGRMYTFNLLGSATVILVTVLLSVFKIHILPSGYQTFGFLMFALCMALSAGVIHFTHKANRPELYDKICFGYLAVFSTIMFNFAFRAKTSAAALIIYSIIMMVIGLLPALKLEVFGIVWAVNVVPIVILALVKGFSADAVTSVITVSVMSFVLSTVSYAGTMRKLHYKLKLDSALSEAETDPMTQLLNRRGLDRRIENLWPHCIRQNTNVAILMLDIDNFKKYNDTFGHAEGDECIRKVTATIRRNVKRRTDYGARVGGEEFLVFLTGIEPKLAVKWALDLKKSIDALKIQHADTNFNPYVSVSMGLACASVSEGITFEKLREEADKSLYEAKYNGRACLYYHHRCFGKQSLFKKAGNE